MANNLLDEFINDHLPAISAAKIEVESYTDTQLIISAPLHMNQNDRGNAFGGCLYNIALVACWGTMFLKCSEKIAKPNIVTRDGQIRYRHPCDETIIRATCNIPVERQWDGFFAHYEKTGKTSLSLTSQIMSGHHNETAAYFDGVFVLLDE